MINEYTAPIRAAEQERTDYYESLRDKYYRRYPTLRDQDYDFLEAANSIINNPEFNGDVQLERDRILAASIYANALNQPMDVAYLNLDAFHEQWTGQKFINKTGIQAVIDSFQLSFVSREYNNLAQQFAKQGGTDPDLLQALRQYQQRMNQLRDHAPKPWQDEYVRMGGLHDLGQWIRAAGTSLAENAVQIAEGMAWATLAATGVGAIASAVGLSAGVSGVLVAGASRLATGLAIAESTYNSTWGIKYMEMTDAGIPHDIANSCARIDAIIEGAIEGALGGVESAGAAAISRSIVPQAVSRATNRFFISGRMGSSARAILNWLRHGFEEGSEEVFQAFSSGGMFNAAADEANRKREELLRKIAEPIAEEYRKELEKELENHPEVNHREWKEILNEAIDGGIAGFLTGIVLGIPIEITNYRHDVRSAMQLADMAQYAPNEAVFKEWYENEKANGFRSPLAGMKADEEADELSHIYKVQQERLTPEQREAKENQTRDAAALREVTDYRGTEVIEDIDDETGEKRTNIANPDTYVEGVYLENDQLYINEHTETNEDGSISGRFAAGDPRIDDDEDQSGVNRYGHIHYTENGDTVTIDEFQMRPGYEKLRGKLWSQFTAKFGDVNYEWNLENEQNIALRDQLIKNNPDGPKNGLNYGKQTLASREAQQIAQRFTKLMPKGTSNLEIAMAVEFLKTRSRKGESLTSTFNRMVANITNDPNARSDIIAAQRQGKVVQGATWVDKTAEGMKRIVYVSKHASNPSTVIHEVLLHAVEADLTHEEMTSAINALNGYEMKRGEKKGQALYFNENYNHWTKEQREDFSEAFAEAGEIWFTHGTAPNAQMKSLFEKIKEFMKRIYELMKGWTELSPEVDKFFQSLFNNEIDQARTAAQTREETHSEAQNNKAINDTTRGENATTATQDTVEAKSPTDIQSHTEAQTEKTALDERARQRDEIINDPDIPLEEKTEVVYDAAGDALYQAGEYDAGEINNQISQRQRIKIGKPSAELKELINKYYKEPKGWRNEIINWAKTIIPDVIKDPEGKDVGVSRTNIRNVISHGKGPLKILTLPNLPEMLRQGVLYHIETKNDKQGRQEHFYNYAYPIQFEGKEWIVSMTVKEDYNGKRFYDNEFIQEIKTTDGSPNGAGPSTRGNLTHPSTLNILRDILSVKSDPQTTLFQIIGEQGAEALDKAQEATTRLDNLSIARQMEGADKDTRTVRLATGWERGADGKWRYEIDDVETTEAFNNLSTGKSLSLDSVLVDSDLFIAYPQLKDIQVRIVNDKRDAGGWNRKTNTIELSAYIPAYKNGKETFDDNSIKEVYHSALLHEIQHAIQDIEGFARGGNIDHFTQENSKQTILKGIEEARRKAWDEIPENLKEDARKINREEDTDGSSLTRIQADPAAKAAWADYIRTLKDYEEVNATPDEDFNGLTAYEQYFRLAGEVEARNTQSRMGFTAVQRTETLLAETEDVAREDQIFIHDGARIAQMAAAIEDPRQLREMAIVPRDAMTLTEAENIVRDKEKGFLNKPITNALFDITATVSGWSLDEMTNEKQVKKAISPRLQAKAVANADVLFERALVHTAHPDTHGRKEVEQVHRFGALMEDGGEYVPVKLTVIEFTDERTGNRLYAIEAVDIEKLKPAGLLPAPPGTPETTDPIADFNRRTAGLMPQARTNPEIDGPIADFNNRLIQLYEIVNTGSQTFFQFGDREMLEEAASFDSYKEWRSFTEKSFDAPMGDYEYEGWTLSEEQKDAWYKSFWENARKAVKAEEKAQDGETQETERNEKPTPAEQDREFKELITEGKNLEEFVERLTLTHNEDYSNWGAITEEDAEERARQAEITDDIRRVCAHTTWQTIFKAGGEMGKTQRKQLLTMIKNSPREYRRLYAEVMEREDLAVSPEDMKAAILKNKITDSKRQDLDSLTPEKLRQIEKGIALEEFAEKVRTGKAKFTEEIEEAYIKKLNEDIKKAYEELKETEEDRQEDNNYFEQAAVKEVLETWDRLLNVKEALTRSQKEYDRAIKKGETDARRIALRLNRENAAYGTIMNELKVLKKMHDLEIDINKALANEEIKEYAKSAKTEAALQKHLAVKAAKAKWESRLAELKEQRENAKALTKAKRGLIERIFRLLSPQKVNAEQGYTIASIQWFAEPSVKKGINEFVGEIVEHDLRPVFERWKTDERLRGELLKDKNKATQDKMNRLFGKEKFEDLTDDEKKYLARRIAPVDWAEELGLDVIAERRNSNYPNINEEAAKQLVSKALPADVYQRIINKPFSAWTLSEAEELAKIVDDLTVQGKEIYKANIDAERRRISAYRAGVVSTIRTVMKHGKLINGTDEAEKILGKYNVGAGGLAQTRNKKQSLKGPLFRYADMNVYRFTRMLDNGEINGKNMSALYRGAKDAYNQKLAVMNFRASKVYAVMKKQKITERDLWQTAFEIDLGEDLKMTKFTAAEAMGFLYASQNDYSRDAIIGGNMLSEYERGEYQIEGISPEEVTALKLLAGERFERVAQAAQKFISENPNFQKLMDVIGEDFAMSGERVSEYLTRYNNNVMRKEKNYFPIMRTEAVNANSAGAELRKDLMGSSAGAFQIFVEKGFTKERNEIPIQYQTAIELDIFRVWTEAMEKQEHFISHGQLVKDLNQIYKKSRPVRDAIERRYGELAVKYIDKYINELANPNQESARTDMDKFVRAMRGNTAAAYLGWKVSGIVKQFITSPAPFFAYMNPLEYYAAMVEYAGKHNELWNEITELSPYMGNRSMSLMVDLIKEQAKHRSDKKAVNALHDFNKMGMKGLEWIDRSCVAPGWLVLFRKEYKRLTEDQNSAKLDEKDRRVKAAQYADDIVGLTQPSSWHGDLPPLFKGNNEFAKAYLQFTQSLSMIWQNIRYDMPQMMRDKKFGQAAGTVIGYTIAGIMLGAITQGFDDDDDEEMKARKIAWWATTQFTDSFPAIGSEITRFVELAFTGETRYQGGSQLLPVLEKFKGLGSNTIKAVYDKDSGKFLKGMKQGAEAIEIFLGLPQSARKEYSRLFGIGDDDEGLGFNPGALAGRR